MCGIVGYAGRHDAVPILLPGLRRLEYRGYDSAGGATLTAEGLDLRKVPRIALIDLESPVVAIAPDDETCEKMAGNIEEVKARSATVVAVTSRASEAICTQADCSIFLPPAPFWIQPLLVALPLQLFAYHVAVIRGCDVDQPRNLAKSVTVE